MPINFKWLLKLPAGRLSRRIAFWVFISVIVIETIIFIPSFQKRKKELLAQIREISTAKITMMMDLARDMEYRDTLLVHLKKLQMDPVILGGTLYLPDGKTMGHFGEVPVMTLQQVKDTGENNLGSRDGARYDSAWPIAKQNTTCTLILRQDASSVPKDLMAYALRISGLVVIISLFVTFGAVMALEPIVLTPILKLRRDLISSGEAILKDQEAPEFHSATVNRQDELGEVISAFMEGHRQI